MNKRLATTYREIFARFAYLPRTMRLIWPATRGWTVAWMAVLILQGAMPAATVFLTRPLVNSLSAAVAAHGAWEQIQPVLVLSAIMAAILVLAELLQAASGWIRNIQSELTRDHVSALIHAKSISVDLAFYDSAEYYDRLHRARDDASVRPLDLLESLGSLMQNGVTLLAMATVLIPYGLWLPFLLILSTLPALIVVLRSQLHYHDWWKHSTPERRRAEYYDQFLTSGEVAAEMRLFDLGRPFGQAYQEQRRQLREEHLRLTRKSSLAQLGARLCAVVIAGAAIVWMGWRMLSGQVTLGDVVL
ncbi:MAG: ABC transporter ATP-binding protein, partial [Roseiflexaceae bacterium]